MIVMMFDHDTLHFHLMFRFDMLTHLFECCHLELCRSCLIYNHCPHNPLWGYHTIVRTFVTSLYRCGHTACYSFFNCFDFFDSLLIVSFIIFRHHTNPRHFRVLYCPRTNFSYAWSVTARPKRTKKGPLKPYLLSEAWC
jgi:hypothetical protein